MGDLLNVDILDVGHGSCVVVRAADSVVLIDTGPNGAILEYLDREGITEVDCVVISHADADHVRGLSAMLSDGRVVRRIYWNGDSGKDSDLWEDIVWQLDDLDAQGILQAQDEAGRGGVISTGVPTVEVALLAPGLGFRRRGAGSTDRAGRQITSNSISVVAQVRVDGRGLLLIPGDLDTVGFENLDVAPTQLKSQYLVLPHHGGLGGTGRATYELVRSLVTAVEPELVFVSNGRLVKANPRAEVVAAVASAVPTTSIACTQLSSRCHPTAVARAGDSRPYSGGWGRGRSCAGTIRLTRTNGIDAPLDRSAHLAFISTEVATPQCGVLGTVARSTAPEAEVEVEPTSGAQVTV
ncbi:ComEC/Rec2 family competence protein [Amnibacterium setariae]|uniref:ComEC/Rec2 family competence protein n=1 Tax=Amnibacterium setariae TaxID=2306585 RepID=UPI001314F2BA|nr:MBL fold metallo-hydrolase [Amnibacterium setariae]